MNFSWLLSSQQQQRRPSGSGPDSPKGKAEEENNDDSSVFVSCSKTEDKNRHNSILFHRNVYAPTTTDNNEEHLPGTSHASSSSCSDSSSCDESGGRHEVQHPQTQRDNNNNNNNNSECRRSANATRRAQQDTKNTNEEEESCSSSVCYSNLFERFQRFRKFCGTLLNNPRFQIIMVGLMIINALLMGVATFDFATDSARLSKIFNIVDQVFLVLFTMELGMQIVYRGIYLVTDPWLLFDAVIILASWSFEKLQVLRCLRILRSLRLIVRIETLQAVVAALIDVGPKVTIILSLLILIMYIYAVLFTSLFFDLYERGLTDADYFGDLGKTFLTLFQMVTLDWASIAWQVTEVYYYAWYIFISFIVITGLILYSLVVAVVCDAVAMQGDEEEKNEIRKMTTRIQELQQRVHEMSQQQEVFLKVLQMQLCQNGDDGHQQLFSEEDLEIFFDSTEHPTSPMEQRLGTSQRPELQQKVIVSEHWVGKIAENDEVEDEHYHHHHHHPPHHSETVNILTIAPVDPQRKKI
jgi:hypothetical protein